MPWSRSGEALQLRRLGSPPEMVLARAEPDAELEDASARRARLVESTGARTSPRAEPPASIDLPLEVRVQTALFFDLPETVQSELSGAGAPPSGSRRDAEQGERCVVTLGVEEHRGEREADD